MRTRMAWGGGRGEWVTAPPMPIHELLQVAELFFPRNYSYKRFPIKAIQDRAPTWLVASTRTQNPRSKPPEKLATQTRKIRRSVLSPDPVSPVASSITFPAPSV